jgi:small-conductance mechanosensitive channel
MSLRASASALIPLAAQVSPTPGDGRGVAFIPGVSIETQTNIVASVLLVTLVFFVRRGVMAVVNKRVEDSALRYRWVKVSANVGFLVTALVLFLIWFTAMRSLGTFLGLLTAGLAIALKDLVADLAGWAFIVWRRPFDVGDRIQIGDFAGDVVDRRIFQFTIMEIGNWVDADQSTGRLIHIPNAKLFTEPLANYIAGFPYLWNELKVTVTFESDWREAKRLLEEVAEDLTVDITREAHKPVNRGEQRFLIHYRKLTPVVYVSVVDSGVLLTLRYLCRPRERRGTAGDLWQKILDALHAAPGVTLAYPTQRINLGREVLAAPEGLGPADAAEKAPE